MTVPSSHQPDLAPPPQLVEVAKKVDARLHAVLDQQIEHWTAVDPRLGEAVKELARMTTSGGKRLRAGFAYWSWRGYYDLRSDRNHQVASTGDVLDAEELIVNIGAAVSYTHLTLPTTPYV